MNIKSQKMGETEFLDVSTNLFFVAEIPNSLYFLCFCSFQNCTTQMELEPTHNPDWVLNSWAVTPTHCLLIEILHTWSQDLMKFRFFRSQHRRNSARDKVIAD